MVLYKRRSFTVCRSYSSDTKAWSTECKPSDGTDLAAGAGLATAAAGNPKDDGEMEAAIAALPVKKEALRENGWRAAT